MIAILALLPLIILILVYLNFGIIAKIIAGFCITILVTALLCAAADELR